MEPCPSKSNSNSPCPIFRLLPRTSRPGFPIAPAQEEIDVYFAHPARDFAQTDEALRLRRKGDANCITYKGPKIDATTKTRREIELPLAPGPESLASWTALLEAVGFRPAGEVRKSRRKAASPGTAARSKPPWTKSSASARSSSSNWLPSNATLTPPGPASYRWPNRSA